MSFIEKWEVGCILKQMGKNWKRRRTSKGILDSGSPKIKSQRKIDS